jgi:hypothetical protein
MKKASLIVASVFLAFTGCGRGWLPCLNRGDACMNQCGAPLAAAAAPACDNCGVNTVGYEGIPSGPGSYSTIGTEQIIGQ